MAPLLLTLDFSTTPLFPSGLLQVPHCVSERGRGERERGEREVLFDLLMGCLGLNERGGKDGAQVQAEIGWFGWASSIRFLSLHSLSPC